MSAGVRDADSWVTTAVNDPRPWVAHRGTPSSVVKKVAPDLEGAADKQCQREGKLHICYASATTHRAPLRNSLQGRHRYVSG